MKTALSGDVSKRLALGGGAETAHELEVEIEQIRARLAANEAERKELEAALTGLSHMTFSELREETSEELIIPAGLFELSLDRSFGAFQPGEVERQSA